MLLDFDKFELIKLLLKNRIKIVWCTRLARAQVAPPPPPPPPPPKMQRPPEGRDGFVSGAGAGAGASPSPPSICKLPRGEEGALSSLALIQARQGEGWLVWEGGSEGASPCPPSI